MYEEIIGTISETDPEIGLGNYLDKPTCMSETQGTCDRTEKWRMGDIC